MNHNSLSQGEPWMTPEERQLNREFVRTTTQQLAAAGIPETPLLMIRINDVIATWLLARRLESALAPKPGEPAPCPTPAQAGAIGKCRDRLRRAIKELEACFPRDAAPASSGLVDQLLQVAQQHAEPAPRNETPSGNEKQTTQSADGIAPIEIQTTQSAGPGPCHNHDPAKRCPAAESTNGQPESPGMIPAPNPPHATPAEQPPPMNRAARRRQAREQRREKRGRPRHPRPA